jgi:predicted acyl esterase
MVKVNVTPFEIETTTRHGDVVRADVYLPAGVTGPFPVLLGASPYQKVGTDTYHHALHPSCLRLHERPLSQTTPDSPRSTP